MKDDTDPTLLPFKRLVGAWTSEATHPMMPGVIVHGTMDVEWLEGERFLIMRSRTDHPDFPDAISVIGHMEADRAGEDGAAPDVRASPLRMHYFDSRGVFRLNDTSMTDTTWRWWREAPGFSQRFLGEVTADGTTIEGKSQLRRDDVHWVDDLQITYHRKAGAARA